MKYYGIDISGSLEVSGSIYNTTMAYNATPDNYVIIDTGSGELFYRSVEVPSNVWDRTGTEVTLVNSGDTVFFSGNVGTPSGSNTFVVGTDNFSSAPSDANASNNTVFGSTNISSATSSTHLYNNFLVGYDNLTNTPNRAYHNYIIGSSNLYNTVGSVNTFNTIFGFANLYTISGQSSMNTVFGYENGRYLTGTAQNLILIGREVLGQTDIVDANGVVAIGYQAFYSSSAASALYDIGIGYRAGFENTKLHSALFGREASATKDNQVVIGSVHYTGGTLIDSDLEISGSLTVTNSNVYFNGGQSVTCQSGSASITLRLEGGTSYQYETTGYMLFDTITGAVQFQKSGTGDTYFYDGNSVVMVSIISGSGTTFGKPAYFNAQIGTALGSGNNIFGATNYFSEESPTDNFGAGTGNAYTATGNVRYNTLIGRYNGYLCTTNLAYNAMFGYKNAYSSSLEISYSILSGNQNAANVENGVYYSSLFGYTNAFNMTGSMQYSFYSGDANAFTATGDSYYNCLIGRQNAHDCQTIGYSTLIGYANIYDATGSINNCVAIGRSNAANLTGNVNGVVALGYANLYGSTQLNQDYIVAMPYEALRETTSTELDGAIAIGYRAGYQTSYNSPALFGYEAQPTADVQVVIGSSHYTGGILLDEDTTVSGSATIHGILSATAKSFVIDHPTKNGKLTHGSLEGPEHGVYYRGTSNTYLIKLPDYWRGLVRENTITCQFTSIGRYQELYIVEKSVDHILVKNKSDEDLPYFDFTIYGERKDIDKLKVED